MSDTPTAYRVDTTAGLRAIIPQLLGFTPEDSMVVIGTEPPRNKVVVTLRYDLSPNRPSDIAAHAEAVLTQAGITTAIAVGYGPAGLTGPVAGALLATTLDIRVFAADDLPDEAPPGIPEPHQMLANRAAVAATVAPVSGDWAQDMRQATRTELQRANDNPAGFTALGLAGIADLIARYRGDGTTVTYDETATVTVALRHLRVRDDAWSRMDTGYKDAHARLWTDLTRLAAPGYVAAPASLLAFVAWQSGNGALANVALDRALADDPRYSMALLLQQAINSGAPPSLARLPLSPEEVAASYDEIDAAR